MKPHHIAHFNLKHGGGPVEILALRAGDHYEYRVLPEGRTATRKTRGVYFWVANGLQYETEPVPRYKIRTRLPPEIQFCDQCGTNRSYSATDSKILGERYWLLFGCPHKNASYWWRPNPIRLQLLPPEAIEKLHSRANRFDFPIPRCGNCGRKMKKHVSRYAVMGGGTVEIATFRCARSGKAHDAVYRIIPNGETAIKVGWGTYRWTNQSGEIRETTPKHAKRKRCGGGRPRGMTKKSSREAEQLLREVEAFRKREGTNRGSVVYATRKVFGIQSRLAVQNARTLIKRFKKMGQKPAA